MKNLNIFVFVSFSLMLILPLNQGIAAVSCHNGKCSFNCNGDAVWDPSGFHCFPNPNLSKDNSVAGEHNSVSGHNNTIMEKIIL